ncbi:MAG TPA: B12-binding domain-containing radical SAM protein, partial [Candidatus Omnitrophota bacterium]|nr:B12-binding domain-containing radical SAM protein [Candidatus Omnitrophota bacterium]
VKKAGLTFAPESADPGVIKAIAKDIDKDVLLKSVKAAFEKSWRAVKLYFMVGFPQSPDGEEKSIVELAKKVSSMRGGRPRDAAEVSLSVNPFIPKPHTPFQWYGMKSRAELEEKRKRLLSLCGPERKIKISFHNVEQSLLEGALARGDRRVSSAVYSAWKKGAMMDGWTESFKPGVWDEAFSENGLSVEAMATRSFGVDDPLPWGHIDSGAGADFLKKEFIDSLP